MSRLLRTKLPTVDINLRPRVQDIKDKQIKIQVGYKAWYDKKANRKEIELIKGQTVMVKKKMDGHLVKLLRRWKCQDHT